MAGLIFGIADYAGDVGARELDQASSSSVYHYPSAHDRRGAGGGDGVIDNVTVHSATSSQCREDAEQGAQMGFDGKWAIHPDQVK